MVSVMRCATFFLVFTIGWCAGFSVEGPRRAVVTIHQGNINGKIMFEQASVGSPVKIRGTVYGLEPGLHGMHVHEGKSIQGGCGEMEVGPHFNPTGKQHGSPRDVNRHVGDLGNIKAVGGASNSRSDINMISSVMSLYENAATNVMNHVLVIHSGEDDLGRGSNLQSLKTGNSGEHIACGVITPTESSESSKDALERFQHGQSHHQIPRAERAKKPATKESTEQRRPMVSGLDWEEFELTSLPRDGFELEKPVSTSNVWKAGIIYEYKYNGFISSGIMGIGPKISGGLISSKVVLEVVDETTINVALRSLSGKMFNEDVLEEFNKANPGKEVSLLDVEHLEKPIALKIINGRIETVSIGKDEPLWTVNFKRGVVSQLQLQLDGSSGVFHMQDMESYYAENTVYHVMEGCATGECQVWYHISRIPKQQLLANPKLLAKPELCKGLPVYEIVKNHNFDKCTTLPIFNYISTPGLKCDPTKGSGCENQYSHVDMVRVLGCKVDRDTFLVQRIKSMDRLVLKPFGYETEALEGLTMQHIELVSLSRKSSEAHVLIPRDVQHIKTLVYAYDIEHVTSGPRLSQPSLNTHITPTVMDVEPSVAQKESERLFREIVADLESNEFYSDPSGKFVADKMSMLRKAISILDKTRLRNFVEKHTGNVEDWSTPQQVLVNALALSGTNPAFTVIRDLILNGRLKGEHAVQTIAMLSGTIKTPTRELLTSFIDLMKSEVVARHRNLKFATALTVTNIVYTACVNKTYSITMFPKMVMGEFCSVNDPLITRQLVPWLNEQLKKATEDIERIAMLAALGNVAHEIVLPHVLPHITSCEPSSTFEADWYERHRRSTPEGEEPIGKKDWRRKWLIHKRKHGKDAKNMEDLLEKFESKIREEKEEEKEHKKFGLAHKHGKKIDKEPLKLAKKEHKEEEKWNKSVFKDAKKNRLEKEDVDEMLASLRKEIEESEKSTSEAQDEYSPDEMDVIKGAGYEESLRDRAYEEEDEEEEEEELYEGIEDKAACNILRVKAIFSLSTFAVHKNDVVHKVLMPVYFNKDEETEVRLAALSMLFVTNPPVAFWERLALSTWIEPNDQVAHYIYTTIASMVNNKDPNRRDITRRAESVLPMMKPMRWTSLVSSNYLKGDYDERTRLGYLSKTVTFPGFESFIPSNHYTSLYLAYGPWWSRLFTVAINGKQAEKLIDMLLGKPGVRGKSVKDEREQAHPELTKIHEELKIEARATGQPEIFIYANLMDNYERFFNINPKTIEETFGNWMRKSVDRSSKKDAVFGFHKLIPLVDAFARIPSAMGLAYTAKGQSRIFLSVKTRMGTGIDFKKLKAGIVNVEGAVKPVMTLEWMSKINVEIPFTRTYPTAGVHIEMTVALPGRYKADVDMVSGKIDTAFELIGDKVLLGRHAVVPFTTIQKVGDYTPALLLPQTKPILLLEEPYKNQKSFGHDTLGLNFIWTERGDVQTIKTPESFTQDWFGMALFYVLPSTLRYHECNLILDNAKSDTNIIKTSLTFATKQPEHISPELKSNDEALPKSIFGAGKKQTKSASRNVAGISESEMFMHDRKLHNLFRSTTDPTGYSVNLLVELVGESRVRRFGSSLAYSVGDFGVSHRGNLILEREADSEMGENFVLCADLDAHFPRPSVVRREEIGRDDISRASTLKIGFGKSCDDRKVVITNSMIRTEEDVPSTTQTKWQERECTKQEIFGRGVSEECLSTRRLAAILNRGVLTIEYNEMPAFVRNATIKVSNMFRYWLGEHMSDNQVDVKNTPNMIRIESVYYPIIGSMDLRVYQPNANTFFHGINLHPIAEAVLPFNPRLTAFRAVYGGPGLCLVDRDSVTTYDGLTYNSTFGGCDQVITKDCSGRYYLAVLAREERNKKVVTIYLNREKIELNAAVMKIKVNDKENTLREGGSSQYVKDNEGDLIGVVRKSKDGFLILESPSHMIRVTVSPEEIVILNSPVHRGRLCGLCGSQTGEKVTDLIGPRKCALPGDLMGVAYELSHPRGCRSAHDPEQKEVLSRVQDQCRKEEMSSLFGMTDRKPLVPKFQQEGLSKHIRSVRGECEVLRNRMIHRGRKRCFSLEPAVKCTEGCEPSDYEAVQMGFHCLPAGSFSDELKEAMQCRPLDELAGKEATTVTMFRVPTSCVPVGTKYHKMHGKQHSTLQQQ